MEDIVDKAKQLAVRMHGSQQYGEQPYSVHLQAVHDVLVRFGINDHSVLAAAWLHDMVEDCKPVTMDVSSWHLQCSVNLSLSFGSYVAQLVFLVTGVGDNRKERTASIYNKIQSSTVAFFEEAVALKLADRIANIENCIATKNEKIFGMYLNEYVAFKDGIGALPAMWEHLDVLMSNGHFDIVRKVHGRTSAGILFYRTNPLQVFIIKPGGPYYQFRTSGVWGIPKGLIECGEDFTFEGLLKCAVRETEEELGIPLPELPASSIIALEPVTYPKSKKTIHCFAIHNPDVEFHSSNCFEMEWPKGSGKQVSFPEVETGSWISPDDAVKLMHPEQSKFVIQLREMFDE